MRAVERIVRHKYTGATFRLRREGLNLRVEIRRGDRWQLFVVARPGGFGYRSTTHWTSDRYKTVKAEENQA